MCLSNAASCHLESLNLNDNAFTGSIPSELGDAASLVDVSMQVNQLVGSIPSSLGELPSLGKLNDIEAQSYLLTMIMSQLTTPFCVQKL